jgi:hypothetical protein
VVGNYFVFTSNVDGHFERSGFAPEQILEIDGSNFLMFGDRAGFPLRTAEQENRYVAWLKEFKGANIVAIEFGARAAIPAVRN